MSNDEAKSSLCKGCDKKCDEHIASTEARNKTEGEVKLLFKKTDTLEAKVASMSTLHMVSSVLISLFFIVLITISIMSYLKLNDYKIESANHHTNDVREFQKLDSFAGNTDKRTFLNALEIKELKKEMKQELNLLDDRLDRVEK